MWTKIKQKFPEEDGKTLKLNFPVKVLHFFQNLATIFFFKLKKKKIVDKNQKKTCGRGRENSETKFTGPRRAQNTFQASKQHTLSTVFPKISFYLSIIC